MGGEITWCVLLGVYCQKGDFDIAIELFRVMAKIEEAEDLMCKANSAKDSALWAALRGACTTSTKFIIAKHIVMKMMELDPDYYLSYVPLANVYRAVGRRDDAVNIRKLIEERGRCE
ncbi:hypothetical protein RJ639_013956 [Escallonia herrerae]|uniref:Pentatricopeptide repeat-containing protein n=1 Tax=Escallonia herrerae TaxID=1293975 RepID=A0AA88VIX2_9ASTE|nr:hypothetical protein RJ639_013956 [Escallonia herrerae]